MKKFCFFIFILQTTTSYGQNTIAHWKEVLKNATHDTTRLQCLGDLGFLYSDVNIDSSHYFLQQGTILSQRFPKHPANLPYFNGWAAYWAAKRNNKNAVIWYQKEYDLAFETNNDRYKKIASFNLINNKYLEVGNYAGSIKALFEFKALLDATKEQRPQYYNALFSNLSVCYSAMDNWGKGIEFAQKILPYCKNTSDSLAYFQRFFEAQKNTNLPINDIVGVAKKAIQLAKKDRNLHIELIILNELAAFYIKKERYKEAFFYAKQTEVVAKTNGFLSYEIFAKIHYGQIALQTRKPNEALQYFKEVIPYLKKNEINDELIKSLQSMSEAYQKIGDYTNAYKYHVEYSQLDKEILGKEKQQIAAELETQYQVSEKEKIIALKDSDIQLQKELTTAQKRQKNITIALLAFAILLASWAFWSYWKKNKLSAAIIRRNVLIEQQSQELMALNQTKDKLFAMIGHDLRSPVAGLQVSLREFSHNNDLANVQQKIKGLTQNVTGLYNTLNNLLQWAMIQMKGGVVNKTQIPLNEAAKEAIEFLQHDITTKNIAIITQIDPAELVVFNEAQLQCVLRNVLSNAIKFTPNDGFIKIALKTTADNPVLVINDTGVGMTAQQLQSIFTKPETKTGTGGEKGTGLGLQLCYDIMKEHGKTIEIDSEVGKGTKISLVF
jgi:signal transduction histidine kinase